jgi:hypothetical protein
MPLRRAIGRAAALGLAAALAAGEALPSDGLDVRLRQVEDAFREGDAALLRPAFATSGKVRVDLKDLTSGQGWYASGQLQVLFARVFQDYATRALRFQTDGVTEAAPGTAFARGRWVRRPRRGGDDISETVVLTLREDKGDWRILEIRTSR